MRKLLLLGALAVGGVGATGGSAGAYHYGHFGPWAQTASFPSANPPGYYTNTYSYAWQYPWYAYYNSSHGPYANWASGGGYAYYTTLGSGHPVTHAPNVFMPGGTGITPSPNLPPMGGPGGAPAGCTVTVNLPADATLKFNGAVATATGAVRTFTTPPLEPGREYGYDLTAEVVRDGRTERVTERVVVRAGGAATVTLAPGGVQTAGAK
ncbi:MAG: hypothetical protein C0501_14875 [Isosphaera sp.]|nr:hypothetical protein [Isosphaera sp.]